MKKLFSLILFIGFISTAHAQFGARAGLNSSNFSDTNFSNKQGFHLGAYYRIQLGVIDIEPGLQYSKKGYKGTEDISGIEVNERLNYIDVPVLVRFNLLEAVNIFGGPQASVLASRKYELGSTTSSSTDVIRGYDIGAVLGVGINLPLGFNVQASYDLGLTSLNYLNTDVKNRVFKVSLGIDILK
ncbi:porin family protein [Algoriphagus sp. SE2]|uniref:porin family protein n=1 Tax=Algoriphagus sp. SE2 TaxID=3141536 RepID=UPI0031CD0DB8